MKNAKDDKGNELLKEALKLYEIPPEFVFASGVHGDTVNVVTHGGKKVIHKKGEPAKFKLTPVQITGIPPRNEKFWSNRLNQGITKEELVRR